jgi:flagellin
MLSIQTNVHSMNAQENLRVTTDLQARTISRLTSGYRINQSGDDAAGLSVANKFRSDVAELTQGVRNANDGLSTLQIIDGGLNNMTKIVDRLKTLATQSASSTFTGDRTVLNNEYTSLLGEIDRQAANIGLGSGDTNASRFNANIQVYLGGGSGQSNSKASVDLSAASNVVNSTGLNLGSTSISGTNVPVQLSATDYRSGSYLDGNNSQTYRVATAAGNTVNITVQGDTGGLTGNEIVAQLNTGLSGTGLTASLSSANGSLQISGSGALAVAVDAATGGTAIQAAVADADAKVNTGKFYFDGGTVTANTTGAQTLSFTPAGGSIIDIAIAATDSKESIVNKLKTGLANSNINVVRIGDEISFQSETDFAVQRDATAGGTGGLGNVAISFNAAAANNATDKSASSDVTANALAALAAIGNAVSTLGTVQGKIGSGQNKLQYAIQLAQSQITNFSAAESRIRDADVAQEAANLTKAQVLSQASMAALAQANSAPQSVLSLLRG